jgi:hypothetical protein
MSLSAMMDDGMIAEQEVRIVEENDLDIKPDGLCKWGRG